MDSPTLGSSARRSTRAACAVSRSPRTPRRWCSSRRSTGIPSCGTTPTRSASTAIATSSGATTASVTGCTSASARPSPGSKGVSCCGRWSSACPGCATTASRTASSTMIFRGFDRQPIAWDAPALSAALPASRPPGGRRPSRMSRAPSFPREGRDAGRDRFERSAKPRCLVLGGDLGGSVLVSCSRCSSASSFSTSLLLLTVRTLARALTRPSVPPARGSDGCRCRRSSSRRRRAPGRCSFFQGRDFTCRVCRALLRPASRSETLRPVQRGSARVDRQPAPRDGRSLTQPREAAMSTTEVPVTRPATRASGAST